VLTELRLGEFEGWGGEQVLRLAPLTLFLGPNGAGKSALLQAVCDEAAGEEPKLFARQLRRWNRELEEIFGHWLTAMGVVDDFSIVRSEEDAKAYALRVKAFRVKAWGSEAYVPAGRAGAGARCALLVLVRAFRRTTKVPVHLDHPESYLQPSAQSALGDALLVAVKARGTQLLVETHSERLLRRIQRRIAEGRACKDRVAVYYIEGRDHGAEIRELVIDECGGIANWPHEFFRDLNDDLAAIAEAAAQRRASWESAGAEQAEDATLDGGGRLVDGHPAGLDLVFGDLAEGQDG
jgi:predicted ATPase